jgi:hypothetical protein
MEQLNIAELIEKNPISRLSNEYNNKFLNKIKDNFTDFEQQLFVSNFFCYLNYNKNTDFVIDLDNIWKWLGFASKFTSQRTIVKHFIINIDYKLASQLGEAVLNQHNTNIFPETTLTQNDKTKLAYEYSSASLDQNDNTKTAYEYPSAVLKQPQVKKNGGQNIKKIFMTIKCFKLLCLKAETKKASEIHQYYIKLEEILQEIIEEETDELKLQLENKDNIILEKESKLQLTLKEKQKAIEETLIKQFPLNTECIYFGTIDNTNEAGETLIKFGHTNNLQTRISDHHKIYDNFVLLEAFKVQNKVEIENLIKKHNEIEKQIRNIVVNERNKTEIIAYNTNKFTIKTLTKYIKDIIMSKSYSIDNFNKLLKQNEEIINENILLKEQIQNNNNEIMKLTLQLYKQNEQINLQEQSIKLYENENKSVYENPLLVENDQTNNFNEFINTMCIVRSDVEESSIDMEGAYRIWNKVKPKKEVFHAFKIYLDTRFKPSRINTQNKNQVVNGYIGVKLKIVNYNKKCTNNDVETFLFQVCKFSPSGKILNSTLLSEFQRWKQSLNKPIDENDLKNVKEYLNNCEYVLKATVWTDKGTNEGYYGILLKVDEFKHKNTSSTGKKVEKIECRTGQILGVWDTIAKAAEAENISAAKMSRSIKNNVIFNDYYYKSVSS